MKRFFLFYGLGYLFIFINFAEKYFRELDDVERSAGKHFS